MTETKLFVFFSIHNTRVSNYIKNVDKKKACHEHSIPVNLIEHNVSFFCHFVFHNFNNSLFSSTFPAELKRADVESIHKRRTNRQLEAFQYSTNSFASL